MGSRDTASLPNVTDQGDELAPPFPAVRCDPQQFNRSEYQKNTWNIPEKL